MIVGDRKEPAQGICRFCGKFRALTKEHLIPKWVFREFKLTGHLDHAVARSDPRKPDPFSSSVMGDGRKGKRLPVKDITVRTACEDCNSGWMSRLQNEAKPQLRAIMLGDTQTLTAANAKIVARWAAMTACSFEYLNGYHFIGRGEHDTIRHGACPTRWVIGIGKADHLEIDHHVRNLVLGAGNQTYRMATMIFVVNKAVFFVAAPSGPPQFNKELHQVLRLFDTMGFYCLSPHRPPSPSTAFEFSDSRELHILQAALTARLARTKTDPDFVPARPDFLAISDADWQAGVTSFASDRQTAIAAQAAARAAAAPTIST